MSLESPLQRRVAVYEDLPLPRHAAPPLAAAPPAPPVTPPTPIPATPIPQPTTLADAAPDLTHPPNPPHSASAGLRTPNAPRFNTCV